MLDLIVQLLGQVGRLFSIAQRSQCPTGDFGVIYRFLPDKGQPEVAVGQLQQARQVLDDRRFVMAQRGIG